MIDYRKLADSVDFYVNHNFSRIEAPWWVSQEIMEITSPKEIEKFYYLDINKKCLVASGEQSFLYIAAKDRLPKGRYQTITPCFRDESIGITHKKCFMKNELMVTDKVSEKELENVINICLDFFKTQVSDPTGLKIVQKQFGYDIEYNGVEIGSYGIRSCSILEWIYATGCAEPRLSRAMQISNKKVKDIRDGLSKIRI